MADLPTTIQELAETLGTSHRDLCQLALHIEQHLTVRPQPKRSGGFRLITAPSPRLKVILRRLDRLILRAIPLSSLLYLRPGSSYLDLVGEHSGKASLLVADIKDFFPSIRVHQVKQSLADSEVPKSIIPVITRLTTVHGSLPQGFPTSSALASIVLTRVVDRLEGLASAAGLKVGLYADNLVVSSNSDTKRFQRLITRIFQQNGFRLHKMKVVHKGNGQEVMGIRLDSGLSVNPEYRRTLREEIFLLSKKRGNMARDQYYRHTRAIRGKIAFIERVNPEQAAALKAYARKWGIVCA